MSSFGLFLVGLALAGYGFFMEQHNQALAQRGALDPVDSDRSSVTTLALYAVGAVLIFLSFQ